jgi:hypothetical protein
MRPFRSAMHPGSITRKRLPQPTPPHRQNEETTCCLRKPTVRWSQVEGTVCGDHH